MEVFTLTLIQVQLFGICFMVNLWYSSGKTAADLQNQTPLKRTFLMCNDSQLCMYKVKFNLGKPQGVGPSGPQQTEHDPVSTSRKYLFEENQVKHILLSRRKKKLQRIQGRVHLPAWNLYPSILLVPTKAASPSRVYHSKRGIGNTYNRKYRLKSWVIK